MNLLKKFSSKNENSYDDDEIYGGNEDNGYYAGEDDVYGAGEDKTAAVNDFRKVPAQGGAGKIALKLVRPESHTDAPKIANQLMSGSIVVLDIDSLERESAIRLIDFLAGVIHVLGGQMIKTNRTTIVVAPNGVDIGDFGLNEARPAENDGENDADEDTEEA